MTMVMGGRPKSRRNWVRSIVPLLVGLVCLWLLVGRLSSLDPDQFWQAFRDVRPLQWFAALAATGISFWALGRYDAVIHRHLRSNITEREAQLSGASAIALGQVLGLGVLTGALARWRLLPSLGPLRAAQVTAAVSLSFLLSWAVITATACALLMPSFLPRWLALAGLALAFGLPAVALFLPELRFSRWRLRLPSVQAMGAIAFFALIDTVAAGLALYVLLPGGLSFLHFLPAFLLALGAGLFAGTPGGVGPFELSLLALLPEVPEPELIAAVLAFRLVYYALPALLAGANVLRFRSASTPSRPHVPRGVPPLLLDNAHRAESGIARQNGARLLGSARDGGLVIDTPQSLTLLFDPIAGRLGPLLPRLEVAARGSNRMALVYKCTARHAVEARQLGWRLLRVADEAVIQPGTFGLGGPRHRQLRRKLRHAEKAGIGITQPANLPLAEMARLDAEWKATHGLARGLSTGRFAPSYVAHQRVYCAWQDGQLIAYVTFHHNRHQFCLDLMRHGDGLPDGTMHLLIVAAIADAETDGLPLSLAAMPARPLQEGSLKSRMRAEISRRSGGDGLTRFKESFAPTRQPLYMAAPSNLALVLGATDLALAMRRPAETVDPLSRGGGDTFENKEIGRTTAR